MAKFGIALALGARDFAGSNPVTRTKRPTEMRSQSAFLKWLYQIFPFHFFFLPLKVFLKSEITLEIYAINMPNTPMAILIAVPES